MSGVVFNSLNTKQDFDSHSTKHGLSVVASCRSGVDIVQVSIVRQFPGVFRQFPDVRAVVWTLEF